MHLTQARNPVKKTSVAILLLSSVCVWAALDPNPAEYAINVHVSASHLVIEPTSTAYVQKLCVVIDGKKYELEGPGDGAMLLALGDYKTKLVRNEHKGTYSSLQVYEFLFPDQKTRKFTVVGQTE
jgi:hypothetical protein